jgi:hypothetical protein
MGSVGAGQNVECETRPVPSRQLIELLAKALLDEELYQRLFDHPGMVAGEFNLSPEEAQAVKLLDRQQFEQLVAQLRSG